MTHLATKIFDGVIGRSTRSNNGLVIFCACVCVFTCSFSLATRPQKNPGPSEEFFELAADLKTRLKSMDESQLELVPASHHEEE